MEELGRRWCRLAIASAAATMFFSAPGQAVADPGATVFPGMEIRQGNTVCMVGLVETGLRVALTSGQCDGGQPVVTDRDRKPIGNVVLGRRQVDVDSTADTSMLPVEYEVIAIAPGVTPSDVLPTGRHLGSAPGMRAQTGMPVCQLRSATGQRCGSVSSVGNGRFAITDMASDSRDFGGPVYTLTDDNNAVIVGLVEGTWRSSPQIESWQAVMAQVYIDSHTYSPQQPPPTLRMTGWRTSGFASP
ncbi:Rv1815 family serine proteinase [Mycobacterium sp. MUNTM1]